VNLGFRPDLGTGLVEVFLPGPPTSPPAHSRIVEPEIAHAVKRLARQIHGTSAFSVRTDSCAIHRLDTLVADAHRQREKLSEPGMNAAALCSAIATR
jgi:hypothetical protein